MNNFKKFRNFPMIGYNRMLCILAIFCMSWQTNILAQNADLNDVHTRRYLDDIAYKQRTDQIEAYIYRKKMEGMDGETISGRAILTIPVVVHVMHTPEDSIADNSGSNLSDQRIQNAINDLNDLFRNRGPFAGDPLYTDAGISSVDTEIEFCLAEFDPQGNPSTGINRIATPLSNLYRDDICPGQIVNQDECLKALSFWDSNYYLNLWLVNNICTSSINPNADCNLTGYSYNAAAHGESYDGPVLASRIFGGASEQAAYVAHEIGHYLGLLDTYYDPPGPKPSCTNNNCLLDGDKVCDTPPDSDPNATSCLANGRVNSCSTDADDTSANNPFDTDVTDMYENYMDNAAAGCRNTFTTGQKDRMRVSLLGVRSSLQSSNGCDLSITNADLVSIKNPGELSCEANLIPQIVLANTGSNVIASCTFSVYLNGAQTGTFSWTGNLQPGDTLEVNLNPLGPVPGRNTLQVSVDKVNGSPDQDEGDNNKGTNFIYTNQQGALVQSYPYCMDFENPAMIEDWLPGDLDGIIGFDTYDPSTCVTFGGNSLRYNTSGNWNNGSGPVASQLGTRDYFIGPQFDLRDFGTASLSFDVAFKESLQSKGLTLKVWVIDDCGNVNTLMYKKSQETLQTSTTPFNPFILAWAPNSCEEWRSEQISLDAFAGKLIKVVFEVELDAEYSQNFYLDNICLEAEKVCIIPENIPSSPGTYVASTACRDDEGWVHYIKEAYAEPQSPTDLLLLSLKDPELFGVELIPEQVRVVLTPGYGDQAHDLSAAPYVENYMGWYTSSRYFQIDTKHMPDLSMPLRTYFNETDVKDLNISLADSLEMQSSKQVAVFTLSSGIDPNPSTRHSGSLPADFLDYKNGLEPGNKTWQWQDHNGFYSATFLVDKLGAGGIGSGGEGKGYGALYPVPFKAFWFEQSMGSVTLTWTTSKEKNTRLFEIYRSIGNENFEKLEELPAAGESNEENTYVYTDIPNSSLPVVYYIKALHQDDLEIFSETLKVKLDRDQFIKVYPNPTLGQFGLDISAEQNDKIEFIVHNASWQRLYHVSWPFNGTNPVMDISHLPAGIYFYDVLVREERYMGKLVLMPGK